MKELGSEVAGQSESSQPAQPNPNPIHRTGRPVETELTSRSSAQEIDTRFSLRYESTNLSVERLDKDKDTDENVDADRVRTGRPVGGTSVHPARGDIHRLQGVWIATCSCETSRKFQCSRTREEDRESPSSTSSSSRSATR